MQNTNASANYNAAANQTFSATDIAKFIDASGNNAIDYAIQRNPSTVYQYIQLNYPGLYMQLTPGIENSEPVMESMSQFLQKIYSQVPAAQQPHWIATLLFSLPDAAQNQNWTTPGTAPTTTITKAIG